MSGKQSKIESHLQEQAMSRLPFGDFWPKATRIFFSRRKYAAGNSIILIHYHENDVGIWQRAARFIICNAQQVNQNLPELQSDVDRLLRGKEAYLPTSARF